MGEVVNGAVGSVNINEDRIVGDSCDKDSGPLQMNKGQMFKGMDFPTKNMNPKNTGKIIKINTVPDVPRNVGEEGA